MMLSRLAFVAVCSVGGLACGPAHQQDTNTPSNPFESPRKGALTIHAPEAPADLRVRRLRPGLHADHTAMSSGQMYNVPPAIVAAFGSEEPLRVTDRGVTLGPVSQAEMDAVWLEGGALTGPRIAHWRPADGQLLRVSNSEVSGNPLQVASVVANTPPDGACTPQPPSLRFGWSETILIGNQIRVEKTGPGTDAECRVLDLAKEGASARMELCPGPASIREGDLVRIDVSDMEQASNHQRARILKIETPREAIWMVRGYTNDLASALAPMGVQGFSWSLAQTCSLTPDDGCGVGGLAAQVSVAFKPGDRSFAMRAGESVRGSFAGAATEIQMVRASFRPFRSAGCRHDVSDFGMVLTRAGASGAKATIAR
jgi:hypothetical protein